MSCNGLVVPDECALDAWGCAQALTGSCLHPLLIYAEPPLRTSDYSNVVAISGCMMVALDGHTTTALILHILLLFLFKIYYLLCNPVVQKRVGEQGTSPGHSLGVGTTMELEEGGISRPPALVLTVGRAEKHQWCVVQEYATKDSLLLERCHFLLFFGAENQWVLAP